MDYFQGIVAEYLRADRACFLNPEFCLLNDLSEVEEHRKAHWYVDILALHTKHRCAYLCEVTYAKPPRALIQRLRTWSQHWSTIRKTLLRDAPVTETWAIRPWLFVPDDGIPGLVSALPNFTPPPVITPLEMTLPWKYKWDRTKEEPKPDSIPAAMRS
jgi:hypothetical protein